MIKLHILSHPYRSLLVVVFLPLTSPESTSEYRAMTSVGVISTSVVQIAVVSLVASLMDPQVVVIIYLKSYVYIC